MNSTNEILMIRPKAFTFNEETAEDNLYQVEPSISDKAIQAKALEEFDAMVEILKNEGVRVNVFQDTLEPETPDSIFPNNWFSTHYGTLILYPMFAENRRDEVVKFKSQLIDLYKPDKIIDLSPYADKEIFLESTGAMVFDRDNKKVYVSLSQRADRNLVDEVAKILGYEAIKFESFQMGESIYHTNVMMGLTSDLAIIGADLIGTKYQDQVLNSLNQDKKIIELTGQDVLNFAGNVLELQASKGNFLLMSKTAYDNLDKAKLEEIEASLRIVTADIPTIEKYGGGSVRCMVAEIYR